MPYEREIPKYFSKDVAFSDTPTLDVPKESYMANDGIILYNRVIGNMWYLISFYIIYLCLIFFLHKLIIFSH